MLIIDLKGRPWWCPNLQATDITTVENLEKELSEKEWEGYKGPWNINPGSDKV